MSWSGNYWGPEGALAQAKTEFENSPHDAADMIAYASVKYSAANRGIADLRKPSLNWFYRLKQALDLASQAVALVDQAWVKQNPVTPYWQNRLDAIDVSCAIWLRWGWLYGGRTANARIALRAVSWQEYDDVVPHTRAFLILHSVRSGLMDMSETRCQELEELASQSAAAGEFGQASRICKQLAQLVSSKSRRTDLLANAKIYAERGQVADQLAKLGHSTKGA